MDNSYAAFIDKSIAVLSGAGISTDSGIPDYRGETGRRRPSSPLTIKQFLSSPDFRRYYWARSAIGWPWIRDREPNESHRALAELENHEVVIGIITQNVDHLHYKAGSREIVELHGSLRRVVCLDCGKMEDRQDLQDRMIESNPAWTDRLATITPDGDAIIGREESRGFHPPSCRFCGGTIKPDVVFFGENVPRPRVDQSYALVDEADVLLVLGSSLTVRSGLRFAEHAVKKGKTLAVINLGPTRADDKAHIKHDGALAPWLAGLKKIVIGDESLTAREN